MSRKEMERKAVDALGGSIEIIYDIYVGIDEVDVIGTIGGDAVHYRVHFKNGEVDYAISHSIKMRAR